MLCAKTIPGLWDTGDQSKMIRPLLLDNTVGVSSVCQF